MLSVVVALAVVIIDFVTKYIVKTSMALGESFSVIPGVVNFTYVLNKGAAWGMLADRRWIFLVFSSVAIVLICVLLWMYRNAPKLVRIALALVLGGGIGNMIDRTFYGKTLFDGAVVDFIEAAFIDFPVFNVADSAVCIGAALLIVYMIFFESKNAKKCDAVKTGGDGNEQ